MNYFLGAYRICTLGKTKTCKPKLLWIMFKVYIAEVIK